MTRRAPAPLLALLLAALPLLAPAATAADLADPADLPPRAQVAHALAANPLLEAAGARIEAAEAHSRGLAAGPHEWTLRLTEQRRTVRAPPEGRFGEWNLGLERSLRLPGKGELDRQLGAAGIHSARLQHGDAQHEARRLLLAGWFEWLREAAAVRQGQRQRELLARQAGLLARRVALGDAPRLERLQADAALAQAEAQLAQARGRADVAAEQLRRLYPTLRLPAAPAPLAPPAIEGDAAGWIAEILAHDHELGVARADSARARLAASRADAERWPDPGVAVHVGNERGGEERLVGLTLSIPLPGEGRRAEADMALAEARASAYREAAVLRRVEAGAAALYRRAGALAAGWQSQQRAADALSESAELSERAWQLGEGRLVDTLNARRLAHEAELAARLAQLDASEARYRLLLDAHRLWEEP